MPVAGYRIFSGMRHSIMDYIIKYYNNVRPHQFNGWLTANEYERIYALEYTVVGKIS
jgi:putative transposase